MAESNAEAQKRQQHALEESKAFTERSMHELKEELAEAKRLNQLAADESRKVREDMERQNKELKAQNEATRETLSQMMGLLRKLSEGQLRMPVEGSLMEPRRG